MAWGDITEYGLTNSIGGKGRHRTRRQAGADEDPRGRTQKKVADEALKVRGETAARDPRVATVVEVLKKHVEVMRKAGAPDPCTRSPSPSTIIARAGCPRRVFWRARQPVRRTRNAYSLLF